MKDLAVELILWGRGLDLELKEKAERERQERAAREDLNRWLKRQQLAYLNALRYHGLVFEDKLVHFVNIGKMHADLGLSNLVGALVVKLFFNIPLEPLDCEVFQILQS